MGDHSIRCGDCGTPFVFTAAEGDVYAARGLVPPKRCRPCRDTRKRARQTGPRVIERPLWEATCTGCGGGASVPFEPAAGRDVFCKACWEARRRAIRSPVARDPGVVE